MEKHIGKASLEFGRSQTNPKRRLEWYANRLYDIGKAEGYCNSRMQRCKRTDTPKYQQYQQHQQEIRAVRDQLIQEMLYDNRSSRNL